MLTRRDVLQQVGMAAAVAVTAPWWLVRRAHAARREKLIVWNQIAQAPEVDRLMKEQCYAYAKQAGIKENELEYVEPGSGQQPPKLVAALEAGIPPDVARAGSAQASLYRSQGHLLEVTDVVEKMQKVPGGLFPVALNAVMHEGKAYGVPHQVSPWPLITRMDILEAAKVDPPKTWDEFIEVCMKLQKPPKLTGFGMCLGLQNDADNNIMNLIWCYGGKLVEADDKTVALNSPGTVQAVQLIADMVNKHKIIPKGAISWDNQGNNKAYQSRPGDLRPEPQQHLCPSGGVGQRAVRCDRDAPCSGRPGRVGRGAHHRGMDPLQAQPLPRGGQRAGPVLHGAGKSPDRHGGRGRALGASVPGHVQQ